MGVKMGVTSRVKMGVKMDNTYELWSQITDHSLITIHKKKHIF